MFCAPLCLRFRSFAGFSGRWVHLFLAFLGLATTLSPAAGAAAGRGELFSPQGIVFERFDAENLLPQSSVYDLEQRADGYLWLVTLDGLVRFDGVRVKVFDRSTDAGIATTRLTAIFDHAGSGDLWVGAEDGRLLRFREGVFETLATADRSLGAMTAVRVSEDGRIYLFQHHGAQEVRLLAGAGGLLERVGALVPGIGTYPCGAAILGEDGRFWRATKNGFKDLPLPPELLPPQQGQCFQDALEGWWLRAATGQLWRFLAGRLVRDPREGFLPAEAIPFAEDLAGNLWLRLADEPHLGRLDRQGRLWRYGEDAGVDPSGDVIRGYFDGEGGLWIGTNTALYRYLGEPIGGLHLRRPDGAAAVASHYQAGDGSYFLATRDHRFWKLGPDGALAELTVRDALGRLILRPDLTSAADGRPFVENPKSPLGYQAFVEAQGALWVGADSGLLRYQDGRLTYFLATRYRPGAREIAGGVNDILAEGAGLWLACGEAVVRFEGGRVVRVWGPAEGVNEGVLTLLRDRRGMLWAGTRAGVLHFDGERFSAVPGLGPEIGQARALHEDENGRLWVGTYDRGLFRRLADGRLEHAGPAEGFPSNGVFTLKVDRRNFLWTSSNRGLLRTPLAAVDRVLSGRGGRVPAVLYGRAAGLPSSECNGGFRVSGYDCFGDAFCVHTLGGIAVARLDEVRVVASPPQPVIEGVAVDGEFRATPGGKVELAPGDRNLLILFSGIAFEGAKELSFRYRLQGYDEDFVATGSRREALFGDLPPGEYSFEAVAENREGLASATPARLLVVVAPAWWEHGAVRLLALVAAGGLVWAGLRWRLRALSRRHVRRVQELRAAAEQLELRVRERTAELDAEVAERRRAEEAARQASDAKSRFLAQMSHELRTPMNAIIGLSELLERSPLAPKQQEWVKTICASGDALLSIIDDILDFSRIEAGRMEVEAREFDPLAVVGGAAAIVGSLAAAKGLTLDLEAAPEVPARVVGDAPRLRQVLLNLLGNAVKFTQQGGVRVHLAAAETAAGWRLEIAIRDTGIGIAAEAQARVFEPFTQADASMSRRFGGSGLGLAICQRVMAALGGELKLESQPGEGSTFTILYPVGRVSDEGDRG